MTSTLMNRPRITRSVRQTPLVVCVDDDPHIAKALRLRLKTMNVDVLQASDGRTGLALIRDRKPDVVISDWWMERGDGEYLLNRLQSEKETAQIPVIMVTGVGRPDFMNRMFAQGALSCYTKPLQFDALRQDLCTLLDLDPASRATNESRTSVGARARRRLEPHDKRGRKIVRLDMADGIAASHWKS